MEYKRISKKVDNLVAYIGLGANCKKSMTVLDEETLKELAAVIEEIAVDKTITGVVFHSHKDRCFIAGADINLIASMKTESEGASGSEAGQKLFNAIEDLKVPTIACVHGVCLGGGLELAMSCQTIIASDDKGTIMGLPEVKLGILPGFGGTWRLPKRVGLPNALDMVLSGKTLDGRKAKKWELVTETYAKERLLAKALDHLKGNVRVKDSNWKDSIGHLATDNFLSRKIIFQKARENVLKKTKGLYQAPLKILDLMEAGSGKGRESYLAMESQAFGELSVSHQSKNLQHIFFMTEAAKKYPRTSSESPLSKLKRGATLGAGTMGGGIAWLMADMGMAPLMKDLAVEGLELGLKQASSNFRGALKRKKISADDFERKMRSISTQLDYSGFKTTDLVIEAVVENMDIKKKVFAEVENYVREDCLLTSNTSSLSVEEMSTALKNPERFGGLHFFNPVHRMPLVEIITHSKMSDATIESLYLWCLKAKKTPVIVKDGPGFLVNRILLPYLNEAAFLMEEGVPVKDLEEACLNFGMPMGPCRLIDEVGIDVGAKVAKILHDGLGERARPSNLLSQMTEKGLLGRKTQKGFFNYDDQGRPVGENGEAKSLLPKTALAMDEVDIQMRVFLPMINEAAYILEDGIVESAQDVDLGMIYGTGFPPFRGGPLKYADFEGLDRILDALDRYASQVDTERYKAANLLRQLVKSSTKFYEWKR